MEKQSQVRIQMHTPLLPVFLGCVILMQIIDPSRVWMLLIIALGGAWLLAWWWVRTLAQSLRLEREIRFGWAQVGDRLEERFTLHNSSRLPALWAEVLDHSDLPGYRPSQVTGVDGRSTQLWRTQGACTHRGIFHLGPASLISSDPLSIYSLSITAPASTTLMVTPPVIPLPVIEVAPGGRAGEGRPRANAPERTVSAASVRPYLPGDSLRWIHWRLTAHHGSPFVRIFDGTPAGDWWIFLDLDETVQIGEDWNSTEEHGVILAASLAAHGLWDGESVGMAANGQPLIWLPPAAGEHQRWAILRALAQIRPGSYSLAELLVRHRPAIGQRASLVIITPNPTGDWIQALLPLIWRGCVPTVLLLNPASYGKDSSIKSLERSLAELSIKHYTIQRELLDRPEAHPGEAGHWKWRVTPSGRAIPVEDPAKLAWRALR
jgi:uncharacterized protein (DUF58 family)